MADVILCQVSQHFSLFLSLKDLCHCVSLNKVCHKAFKKNEIWNALFHRLFPDDDSTRVLVPAKDNNDEREMTCKTRQGQWFQKAFQSNAKWYVNVRNRYLYAIELQNTLKKTRNKVFIDLHGDTDQHVVKTDFAAPFGASEAHNMYVCSKPIGLCRTYNIPFSVLNDNALFSKTILLSLLDVSAPTDPLLWIDSQHVYNLLWLHVFQNSNHCAGMSWFQLFLNGDDLIVCPIDHSFGVSVQGWKDPCSVVIWGEEFLGTIDKNFDGDLFFKQYLKETVENPQPTKLSKNWTLN